MFSSNRYWRIAGVLGSALTNKVLHEKLGLLNIEEYYDRKYKERMELDRTHDSQMEFIFF